MFRFATAILISAVSLTAFAAETNQPAASTPADALLAAMSAQKETNSIEKAATAVVSEEELKASLALARTLRFQKSFDLAEKQAGDLVTEENPPEIRRLAMLELAYIAQDAGQ